MQALLIRIAQAAKVTWWAVACVGMLGVAILIWLLRNKQDKAKDPEFDPFAAAVRGASNRIAAANAQAAVEIAVARTNDTATRFALTAALAEPDGAKRRRDLIALRQRLASP